MSQKSKNASRSAPPKTGRELARAVLARVEEEGAFANRALSAALDRAPALPGSERGLATELVYGVLRRRARLDRALAAFATKGLDGLDPPVRTALRVGAYQLLFLDRVPAYAAVHEAVDACKRAGGEGAGRLANALLRRVSEKGEPPLPDPAGEPRAYLIEAAGLPAWLVRLLIVERGEAEALAFADALATPAPLVVRANTLRGTREALAARLAAERPEASISPSDVALDALLARDLDAPGATAAFREGLFAIEDVGAQIVAELCGARAGERVLDACAGLGGKSAHLAALAGGAARVLAVDLAAAKLDEARASFTRLGVTGVETATADLTRAWADPAARFDRVLLDAPCSGLGVLRRHPETLLRRGPDDLPRLAAQQRRMLDVVAPLVAPGGTLTYSVCTFERTEGEDVVATFLAAHPEFRVAPPEPGRVPWARLVDRAGFVRTWPHRDDADAFFAARLARSR
ncbi:MAG TPA: 16S rRNA (cytosine(967)-C(5))-methyltransferase RsmB [Polyangia bacterium]|nr:16S rRNA (cytosine(967)-C(5))-methyltransferase RsmB [Polyangia bacterium]